MDESAKMPVCCFAKPPVEGRSKTRLAAKIGSKDACRLAAAFISDFFTTVSHHPWAVPVLATTEDGMPVDAFPAEAFPSGAEQQKSVTKWQQGDGDLGNRIEGIIRGGLEKYPAVICCAADSPGRPEGRLAETRKLLLEGTDVVLGPIEDGGYDILAMRVCPAGLLDNLPWSQPTTFEASKKRFEERGLKVALLERWWDVDEAEDLEHVRALMDGPGALRAPATARVFKELKLAQPPPLTKPSFGKVADIVPDSANLNLKLKCVSCKEVQAAKAWDAVCGDATGTVILRLTRAEHVALCTPGASLRVQNAKVSMVAARGYIRVVVDKWAVLKASEESLAFEANSSNAISEVEFQADNGM